MKIKITSKKPVIDDVHGRLSSGQEIEITEHKALWYIARNEAVAIEIEAKPIEIETKVIKTKSKK